MLQRSEGAAETWWVFDRERHVHALLGRLTSGSNRRFIVHAFKYDNCENPWDGACTLILCVCGVYGAAWLEIWMIRLVQRLFQSSHMLTCTYSGKAFVREPSKLKPLLPCTTTLISSTVSREEARVKSIPALLQST